MRDLERWKDKVEVSLDGRQIFFLFFGSAVAVCVVFMGGMLVGKRVEQRAYASTMPAAEDPLAVLDRMGEGEEADDGLTFHQALVPTASRHHTDDKAAEKSVAVTKPIEKGTKIPEPKVAEKSEPAPVVKPVVAPPAVVKPAVAKPAIVQTPAKPDAKVAAAKVADAKIADAKVADPKIADAKVAAATPIGRFTLQLSAFPDKSDADQFLQKMRGAGFSPFLVHADVPGRGIFYRVRVGDYATMKAALAAKADIERNQHVIAYVARL